MKTPALAASGCILWLAGCGLASNPQPPTLRLPEPVKDLSAARAGNAVDLHWTMPRHTTDNVELKGPQPAHVCWMRLTGEAAPKFDARACRAAGSASYEPDKPAEFRASLPAELLSGAPTAVAYFVELMSPAGKTAGPSNAAWAATGPAPPAVSGLHLEAQPEGVVVRWAAAQPEPGMVMRLRRRLLNSPASGKQNEQEGAPVPPVQTLEVDLSSDDSGGAVDHDAALDHAYEYTAQRVVKVTLEGHPLEIAGLPSRPVTIDAKDVFPPPVPEGLAAVADEETHAIDLSWRPDSEADLAGYVVYRRDVTAGTGWERISGKAPLVAPAYEDRSVTAGHQYAYAVSAVNANGYESGKSGEVVEEAAQ